MKARAHAQGWTLNSYPGKVKIPTDILRPLPSVQAGAEVRTVDLRVRRG